MEHANVSRRDFNKLTAAVFGGMVAGTLAGCGGSKKDDATNAESGDDSVDSGTTGEDRMTADSSDVHVCKGLNACKGKGAGGDNACAGQGTGATAEKHDCQGMNACKGQGGCGETPGQNACKGKGECAVPLSDETWAKARTRFEEKMKAADKPFGEPPA